MISTTIRTPYTPRVSVVLECKDPSRTKQEFKEESDINNIMRRYAATGVIEHLSKNQATYADLPDVGDFQTAQNILIEANNAFSSLPSAMRTRFDNDPAAFLEFVGNPDNADEMRKMGLMKAKEVPTPVPEPESKPAPKPGTKTPPIVSDAPEAK